MLHLTCFAQRYLAPQIDGIRDSNALDMKADGRDDDLEDLD